MNESNQLQLQKSTEFMKSIVIQNKVFCALKSLVCSANVRISKTNANPSKVQ